MEQLALHIEYLLRHNDCVILPGFGAFINAYIPAHYDTESATWIPMRREIRFNQAVNQDDGLLANSYSRKYSLPFHEARALLDADLKYLGHLIHEEGEVTIGRIGSLYNSEENLITYRPFHKQNVTERELGLIPIPTRLGTGVSDTIVSESSPASIESLSVRTDNNYLESEIKQSQFDTEKNYYIPVNKIFAKVAASFIVISIVVLCGLINTDGRLKEDKASVIPVDTTSSVISQRMSRSKTELKSDSVSTVATNISVVENDNVSHGKNDFRDNGSPKRYHLIIGTFRSEREANQYAASINQDSQIISSATLYRVAIASSDDKGELINILNSAEGATKYPGAWIYEDKSAL